MTLTVAVTATMTETTTHDYDSGHDYDGGYDYDYDYGYEYVVSNKTGTIATTMMMRIVAVAAAAVLKAMLTVPRLTTLMYKKTDPMRMDTMTIVTILMTLAIVTPRTAIILVTAWQ